MIETFTQFILDTLSFLGSEMIVFVVSMMPLIELRGAIPIGLFLGLDPVLVFFLTFLASLIPGPFIILLIKKVFDFLERFKFFEKLIDRIIRRNQEKHREKIEKYGYVGLLIIVAIPLPGTGVWSGSLAAALFDLKFFKAMLMIILGNLMAAMVIMMVSLGVINLFFV